MYQLAALAWRHIYTIARRNTQAELESTKDAGSPWEWDTPLQSARLGHLNLLRKAAHWHFRLTSQLSLLAPAVGPGLASMGSSAALVAGLGDAAGIASGGYF